MAFTLFLYSDLEKGDNFKDLCSHLAIPFDSKEGHSCNFDIRLITGEQFHLNLPARHRQNQNSVDRFISGRHCLIFGLHDQGMPDFCCPDTDQQDVNRQHSVCIGAHTKGQPTHTYLKTINFYPGSTFPLSDCLSLRQLSRFPIFSSSAELFFCLLPSPVAVAMVFVVEHPCLR